QNRLRTHHKMFLLIEIQGFLCLKFLDNNLMIRVKYLLHHLNVHFRLYWIIILVNIHSHIHLSLLTLRIRFHPSSCYSFFKVIDSWLSRGIYLLCYLVIAAATPPSTVTIHPVAFAAFDDDRNAIDSAMSCGSTFSFKIVRLR